jgi:hypothetical protein
LQADVVYGVNSLSDTAWNGKVVLTSDEQHVEKIRVGSSTEMMYGTQIGSVDDFDGTGESDLAIWFGEDRRVYYRWLEGNDWGVWDDYWVVYKVKGGWDLREMGRGVQLHPFCHTQSC